MKKFLLFSLFLSLTALSQASKQATAAPEKSQPSAEQQQPDEQALRDRVSGRWQALFKKDFPKAYTYFSPTYRSLFPLEHYLKRMGNLVDWKSIQIQKVQIDGNSAKVNLLLRYRISAFGLSDEVGTIETNEEERWLWKDGNWWYVDPGKRGL